MPPGAELSHACKNNHVTRHPSEKSATKQACVVRKTSTSRPILQNDIYCTEPYHV